MRVGFGIFGVRVAYRRAAVEEHAQVGGAVEPGVRASMPHVLSRGDELRQDEGAFAQKALQFEDATSRGREEQVVVEQAGVDRLREGKRITLDIAVDVNDGDARLVEYAGPDIGVIDVNQCLAAHVAVDGKGVGLGSRTSEKGIDSKS